jgi:hypothetical protein
MVHALQPERFAGDLYFDFGPQNAFTAFSALYAPLVGATEPSATHRRATILGHACWLAALICLVRSVFAGRGHRRGRCDHVRSGLRQLLGRFAVLGSFPS